MKPKPINQQTPGPCIARNGHLVIDGAAIAHCRDHHGDLEANAGPNAALFAAAYTSFDRAARKLGVDAVELAESLDLAALVRSAQDLQTMVRNVLTDSQLDKPQLGGARAKCAATIRAAMAPLATLLSKLPAKG